MEKIHEDKDSAIYRFQCDCYTPAHALDVEVDEKCKLVMLFFWTTPNSFWQRIKWCWKMLRTGEGYDNDFVLRSGDITELAEILQGAVKEGR